MSELMNVGGVGAPGIGGIGGLGGGLRERAATGGVSFADTLKSALGEFSVAQEDATQKINAFARGEPVELHQVMAAAEETGIQLEMLVEVRNKLLEAYQTLANMQS